MNMDIKDENTNLDCEISKHIPKCTDRSIRNKFLRVKTCTNLSVVLFIRLCIIFIVYCGFERLFFYYYYLIIFYFFAKLFSFHFQGTTYVYVQSSQLNGEAAFVSPNTNIQMSYIQNVQPTSSHEISARQGPVSVMTQQLPVLTQQTGSGITIMNTEQPPQYTCKS